MAINASQLLFTAALAVEAKRCRTNGVLIISRLTFYPFLRFGLTKLRIAVELYAVLNSRALALILKCNCKA
jgi:hypothetical protein